jgi:fructosamine-3-kinase
MAEHWRDRLGSAIGVPVRDARPVGGGHGGRGWLIDPAAHSGHRETDLAMLALFGAPYLDRILAAYTEVAPLAPGWQARVPLHQLHPLLVHVCLFGARYRDGAISAARAALAA